jgi:2-hydroxychromene-2-carboxylate isomerase
MLLDAYFDYSSPFAYLGFTQVERVAREAGAELRFRPFLLGGLFKAIGTPNVPMLAMSEAKQRYQLLDMRRWAHHWGVRFQFPTRFPMNTVTALRMTLQLPNGELPRFARAVFEAYWADDRDIADSAELASIAEACGLDGAALLAGAARQEVKDRLRDATEEAARRGVCGAPSFLVRTSESDEGMLFWGQDRLELVAEALGGWRPACG